MKIELTEQEALILYKMIYFWDKTGDFTANEPQEKQLLYDLHCVLEKELEPVNETFTKRMV